MPGKDKAVGNDTRGIPLVHSSPGPRPDTGGRDSEGYSLFFVLSTTVLYKKCEHVLRTTVVVQWLQLLQRSRS